jgi:hypothetical protein
VQQIIEAYEIEEPEYETTPQYWNRHCLSR